MSQPAWKIDASHSAVHFSVRHMVVSKVRGRFSRFEGDIAFDEANPQNSSVKVTLDTSSIDTNEPKRDEHLRSADFFDAAHFPTITFESRKIEKSKEGYQVHGE